MRPKSLLFGCAKGSFVHPPDSGVPPGSLTPRQLSHLAHFASVVSFERAAKFLMQHHGVQVSASTSRRQTEAIGASAEEVQNEQAKDIEKQETC